MRVGSLQASRCVNVEVMYCHLWMRVKCKSRNVVTVRHLRDSNPCCLHLDALLNSPGTYRPLLSPFCYDRLMSIRFFANDSSPASDQFLITPIPSNLPQMQSVRTSRISANQYPKMYEAAKTAEGPVIDSVQPGSISIHAENFLRGVSEFEEYQKCSRAESIKTAKQDISEGRHRPQQDPANLLTLNSTGRFQRTSSHHRPPSLSAPTHR